jgi:hypothetical protein
MCEENPLCSIVPSSVSSVVKRMSVANPLRPFVSWRFIRNERSELIPNKTAIPIHEGLHRLVYICRSSSAWKMQGHNPRNPLIL